MKYTLMVLLMVTWASADKRPHAVSKDAAAVPVVAILRDDRVLGDDGSYTVDFEAENGITVSESGSPDHETGAVVKTGHFGYTSPDGTHVVMKYVADEHGFQPESDLLPVAPDFPHPIPQFVLDQIAFAAEQEAAAAARDHSHGHDAAAREQSHGHDAAAREQSHGHDAAATEDSHGHDAAARKHAHGHE